MRRVGFIAVAGALAVGGWFSCGGNGAKFGGGPDGASDADIPGQDSAFVFPETGADGGACPHTCSSDLHAVIDCNNNVITACTGTDGCDVTTGTCVNACQAAIGNKNSVGCEYYPTQMDTLEGASYCFAAFVANTWDTPATINVDWKGTPLTVASFARIPTGKGAGITYGAYSGTLPAGQVAILFLAGDQGASPSCPIASAEGLTALTSGTGIGNSFHITTDVPVVAYEMNPYGGGSVAVTGASLLLPVSAWDTNYIASTASPDTVSGPGVTITTPK